jgi:uncharacterized OB-fold protein
MSENKVEPVTVLTDDMYTTYRYSYGRAFNRFFQEMRDHARFVGPRCPSCGKVLMLPQEFCPVCFVETLDDWVEVPDEGQVKYIVDVTLPFYGQTKPLPYTFVGVVMEGVEGHIGHFLEEAEKDEIRLDMRVKAVWKPKRERKGDFFDMKYWKPIKK